MSIYVSYIYRYNSYIYIYIYTYTYIYIYIYNYIFIYIYIYMGSVGCVVGCVLVRCSQFTPRSPWPPISSPCLSTSVCLRRPSLRLVVIMAAAAWRRRARGGCYIVSHLFQGAKGRASHTVHKHGELRGVHSSLQRSLCRASGVFTPERA